MTQLTNLPKKRRWHVPAPYDAADVHGNEGGIRGSDYGEGITSPWHRFIHTSGVAGTFCVPRSRTDDFLQIMKRPGQPAQDLVRFLGHHRMSDGVTVDKDLVVLDRTVHCELSSQPFYIVLIAHT